MSCLSLSRERALCLSLTKCVSESQMFASSCSARESVCEREAGTAFPPREREGVCPAAGESGCVLPRETSVRIPGRMHVTGKCRDISMQHTCSRHAAWDPRKKVPSCSDTPSRSHTPSHLLTERLYCVWARGTERRERYFFIKNLQVRIHFIIEIIIGAPASRHVSSNSLFQVALHSPS